MPNSRPTPQTWMQTEPPSATHSEALMIPLEPHHVATFCLSHAGGGYTPASTAQAMLLQHQASTPRGVRLSRLEATLWTPDPAAPTQGDSHA